MAVDTEQYYILLGVLPDCSGYDLRRAYRRLMLAHHPDRNPANAKRATEFSQRLSEAYRAILRQRDETNDVADEGDRHSDETLSERELLRGLRSTKNALRMAWERYAARPSDTFAALQLAAAAIRANRVEAVQSLLCNAEIVSVGPGLCRLVETENATEVLIKWAEWLTTHDHVALAVTLLEDCISENEDREGRLLPHTAKHGKASLRLRTLRLTEERQNSNSQLRALLARVHYEAAQGYLSADGRKPSPMERLGHLRQMVKLGRDEGYVRKLMAEAAHEFGDDSAARKYLAQAFKRDPQLSGAIRISRVLGFAVPASAGAAHAPKATYHFRNAHDIPTPRMIEEWASKGDWESVIRAGTVDLYYPRILPRARDTLRHTAYWLHRAGLQNAAVPLEALSSCIYWDVREEAMMSLARVGTSHTARFIRQLPVGSGNDSAMQDAAVEFLSARLRWLEARSLKAVAVRKLFDSKRYLDCCAASQVLLDRGTLTASEQDAISVLHAAASSRQRMHEHAYHTLKPIMGRLDGELCSLAGEEVIDAIWSVSAGRPYERQMEGDYLQLTRALFGRVLNAATIEIALASLYSITRWMEIIGDRATGQWVRDLLRHEAPGTGYADEHDRVNYVREADWSAEFAQRHHELVRDFKESVLAKLPLWLKDRRLAPSKETQ